jgi:hypothetical protein
LCSIFNASVREAIFNASVREGFVPSIWKAANITPTSSGNEVDITPIQKSSPPKDADSDFRPISLTPIISKILESFPTNGFLTPSPTNGFLTQALVWH